MKRGGGLYYRTINRWDNGIITSGELSGRGDAPYSSLLDAINVRIANGTIKPRNGQIYLDIGLVDQDGVDIGVAVPSDINGLYQYVRQITGVTGISFYSAYVFAAGTGLYMWDGVGDPTKQL